MAIGTNYSILLSLQFDDDSNTSNDNVAMSITDLYEFNKVYIGKVSGEDEDDNYSLLGLTSNGNTTEIINMKQIPVDEDKQYNMLKEILKEVNSFLSNSISQTANKTASRSSYMLKLDTKWINKTLNS